MYPMYRFMDTHPYQRNQVPHDPPYYPQFEPNHHHLNIDPARSSVAYKTWPCVGNYGHPYPPPCHNCCIHNNSPSECAFSPPYPYFPLPLYSNCSYPAYPMVYAANCVPPHFTMDQPRYEYDKNMGIGHHCCGCPNHSCNKKGGNNVKIEEQDQDKKNESNESLVPFGFKNCPYPVLCMPPDYMKNSAHVKPNGFEGKRDEVKDVKPYGDCRSFEQPNIWNVWSPYQGNNSELPKQRGDPPRKQHHDDMNKKQFPFPIIWMPYKPEETDGKVSKETGVDQEQTSPLKSTIPKLHDVEEERSDSREKEVNSGSEIRGKGLNKDSVTKIIPVRQMEQIEDVLDGKPEDASQQHVVDAKEKKTTEDGGKKQSSTPTKSSKLPPVCLRVDPLPRKKSSNGISRSPSPPGVKRKLVESPSDSSKSPILSNEKENVHLDKSSTTGTPEKSIEVEPSKGKRKVVEVALGTSKEDKLQDQYTVFPDLKGKARGQRSEGDTSKATNELKHQPDGAAAGAQSNNQGHQIGEAREAAKGNEGVIVYMKPDRSKLSDDKAATVIQSAYRGFNVRRWEPLKKLKQITKIKEQTAELKNCIQALESSADNVADNKQRTILTEAVMGLLLKLDAIQGLHPTVREFRKSVAKELVSLQEKLDHLNCKKQLAESEQALTDQSSGDACRTVEDNISMQGGQEVPKFEQDGDLAQGGEGIKLHAKEPCQEQPLCAAETLPNSHHVGNAEEVVGKEESENVEEVVENFSSGGAVEMVDEATESLSESKENLNDKSPDENAVVVEKSEEHDKAEQSLLNPIPFSVELTENLGLEVRGCGLKEKGEGVDELEELPRGVLDEETSVQGSTEIRKDEVLQHDNGNLTAHIPEEKVSDTERRGHHHLEALGETLVVLGPMNMHSSNGQKENSEVLETDKTVRVDATEQEKEALRPLNEDGKISDVDDKVGMEDGEERGQCGTGSDAFPIYSQEETITMKQSTDATNMEELETTEVLQEKMQNAVERDIEILNSKNPIELSAEPQLSTATIDVVKEYYAQDMQNVGEENMEAQGEELPARSDALVSVLNSECKENNVEVEQRHLEENFEMQEEEPVAADNAAPVTKEPMDESIVMAAPKSEAATTDTQLLGEKELSAAEDRSTYPSTCDTVEGNTAGAVHSFGSTPNEVRVMDAKELKEWKRVEMSPSSPTASQVSFDSDAFSESSQKLIEENEKLREMMEKLIKAGKEQLTAVSSLSGRVKDLEKRLSRKKKLRLRRYRVPRAGSVCMKPSNDSLKDRAAGLAM
ncbi:PREDICTED: BAG family molecular chaperone regulator 6 [Nicotiana attenuata]|uniref:Bag family molecular chaperone regulator 6 n=1 Tax=Nicotiana attenuata TaxID=49451 RepID=A0A1J6J3W5_NICAT|nr:PREDICTED: BAG family molecular chaperone regulator 6 [Nicotiana attenuata]OIT07376.1 bag family molecular chaperone regulator 6 [Nicotiana attenuata]